MRDHFTRFAAYNGWANARLYDAATALSDFERKRELKAAYFKSLHGTLNHILVADRIWMKRLTGEGEAPAALNTELYSDFSALREAREREDQRIADHVQALPADGFGRVVEYADMRAEPKSLPLSVILAHLFNHQTHHRGQASGLLRQLGVAEPPSLDLVYFALTGS